MVSNEALERRMLMIEGVEEVQVTGDGKHFELTIVSDVFLGQPKVARQRWVYAQLKDDIMSGSLHAISMNTWTKSEWEKQHG